MSEPGPWSPWWCRVHRRCEDPGPVGQPFQVCPDCDHVYATMEDLRCTYTEMISARRVAVIDLCPWCLARWW